MLLKHSLLGSRKKKKSDTRSRGGDRLAIIGVRFRLWRSLSSNLSFQWSRRYVDHSNENISLIWSNLCPRTGEKRSSASFLLQDIKWKPHQEPFNSPYAFNHQSVHHLKVKVSFYIRSSSWRKHSLTASTNLNEASRRSALCLYGSRLASSMEEGFSFIPLLFLSQVTGLEFRIAVPEERSRLRKAVYSCS